MASRDPAMIGAEHIRGMTHPQNVLIACTNLWKKQGAFTASVSTSWAERLLVLTESALFWFERGGEGSDGLGQQRGRVDLRAIRSIIPTETPGSAAVTTDELERHGPKYLLEVSHIMSGEALLIGGTDQACMLAWQQALGRQMQAVTSSTPDEEEKGDTPDLLKLELTGIHALGILGKAREAATGVAKDMLEHAGMVRAHKQPKDGWSTRMLVVTEHSLWFYKPSSRHEDDASGSGSVRSGDYIFGKAVGRMPLGTANVSTERVREPDGSTWTHIIVHAGAVGFSTESLISRGIAKVARTTERGSNHFKATLRTMDEALADEWLAVLRAACGRQRSAGLERLQVAIAQGEVQLAARLAEEMAALAAAVPGRPRTSLWGGRGLCASVDMTSPPLLSVSGDAPAAGRDYIGVDGAPGAAAQASAKYRTQVGAAEHRRSGRSTDEHLSSDDLAEVPATLVPARPPSATQGAAMRQELLALWRVVAMQREALQAAHDALLGVGAAAAAAAVSSALAASAPRTTPAEGADADEEAEAGDAHAAAGLDAHLDAQLDAQLGEVEYLEATCEAEAVRNPPVSASTPATPTTSDGRFEGPDEGFYSARPSDANEEASPSSPPPAEASEKWQVTDTSEALSPGGTPLPPPPPTTLHPAEEEWAAEEAKPKAGFTMASDGPNAAMIKELSRLSVTNGDGTQFDLRVGPNYKLNGKKEASAMHVYNAVTCDVFKRKKSIQFHVSQRLTLPPPPDGKWTPNLSGLPRRLVINCILPAEAPSLMGSPTDGACYQIVIVFSAAAADLQRWIESNCPASRLFKRFWEHAPEGVLPSNGDLDIKERMKLLPRVDNMKSLGLGWVAGYNGKPALITKSGSIYKGDDYLEICMNTMRFAYLTKKGVNSLFGRIPDFELHAAVTIEGREDSELPEQAVAAVRITGLDLLKLAFELAED